MNQPGDPVILKTPRSCPNGSVRTGGQQGAVYIEPTNLRGSDLCWMMRRRSTPESNMSGRLPGPGSYTNDELIQRRPKRLHAGRLGGLIYLIGGAQLFVFDYVQHDLQGRRWAPRIVFTAGWWLSFCDKHPARSLANLVAQPRHAVGIGLIVIGLVAPFYWPLG
jgi:hypothetical protein